MMLTRRSCASAVSERALIAAAMAAIPADRLKRMQISVRLAAPFPESSTPPALWKMTRPKGFPAGQGPSARVGAASGVADYPPRAWNIGAARAIYLQFYLAAQ